MSDYQRATLQYAKVVLHLNQRVRIGGKDDKSQVKIAQLALLVPETNDERWRENRGGETVRGAQKQKCNRGGR